MQRILLAIAGAAAFCAAVTFLLQIAISRGLPATDIVLVTASATLLLSIGAAAFAYRAFNRANLVASELERLTRSMDAAIKDVSLRGDRDAAKLEDLNTTVSSRIEALSARISPNDDSTEAETNKRSTDFESHAPTRKGKHAAQAAPPAPETQAASGIDVALRRMVAGGQADLSLQPIIAAGRGEAGGFEAHFHIQPEEGKPVDIRRLERQIADVDPASYERLAVVSATEAARRRLGEISEKMPVHVAISSALLEDELEFTAVTDIFKLHPALAKSVVMSLPAELVEADRHSAALDLLFGGLDIRLAAEDWSGSQEGLTKMTKVGVSVVKIPAERLLDRAKVKKGAPNGAALVEIAANAGVDVIATDVHSEEDAVSLIDMGVDLMSGERLSAPRRLKMDAGSGARRS